MSHEFQADKGWRVWWKLTRPHTLTASFAPVFLGTMIALYEANIDWLLFIAMLLACLLIQAATNMFNEYYDFVRGLDSEESVGIGGAIVRNGVKPKTVMQLALLLYLIAAILGIYICYESSWLLLVVGAISMAVGYFYTGGPYPISSTPFGELFSGLFMGMLIVLIAVYIQVGSVPLFAVWLSVPSALLVAAIMLSNNIRDLVEDTIGGRKTMAILVGRKNAITILASYFILSYLWIIALVVLQIITPWSLLVLLSMKKPIHAIKLFKQTENPVQVAPAMKDTALTNTIFVFLLGLGLLIGYYV
ncbi:1,4-dihydroxy-2-naphthoate polyprenyltransferase [Psychrobacillus psychrodurans]|uniref:1,4-dihydroxy-2-naphthoate polyprenyltransferase n=1 Tax=Psychrobacillus TaxID=1221880 RepID=UPI0008E0EB07|nr:1,4-dihydroxy-2-naphthoate polyprenyltransferase [Psychrobacillus psychrodurans]MCK1996802.1 1,4-dihydroxy-2-naphthoate polyprenyltransferase [Psychrobacillus psychrodurans]MCZ8541567.1 1,4-dihydroxy-2-naphthoate polyprenyltransferase [Psychrobacillus psychrodurans]SFN05503.1 1,4-dihydroxy-2-naphthoate octaprenyltransferase [Psychrobacillus psychrodurans]